MTASRKLRAGLLAGASFLCLGFAPSFAAEAGLIGKRYAGPDFTYDHFTGSDLDQAFGAAAEVNLPVARAFDLNVGYAYADATGDNRDALEKRLTAGLLTHRQTEYGTGYFAASLGHAWQSSDILGVSRRDNGAFWGVRAGYEIAVGTRSAIDAGIGFVDAFDSKTSGQTLSYRVAANHWFSRDLAGVAGVAYQQIKSAPDAVRYTLGLRWAF